MRIHESRRGYQFRSVQLVRLYRLVARLTALENAVGHTKQGQIDNRQDTEQGILKAGREIDHGLIAEWTLACRGEYTLKLPTFPGKELPSHPCHTTEDACCLFRFLVATRKDSLVCLICACDFLKEAPRGPRGEKRGHP